MRSVAEEVYARLDALGIPYDTTEHPPVHTIGDCAPVERVLHCMVVKNYFLTTKNQKHFYLCLVRPDARFRTADISKQAGSSRLCFANEEQMERLLRVHPGAVSPMGLLFDEEKQVELLVDAALRDVPRLGFHPCDNERSLAMTSQDFFERFLPAVGREPRWVEIHDFQEVDAP